MSMVILLGALALTWLVMRRGTNKAWLILVWFGALLLFGAVHMRRWSRFVVPATVPRDTTTNIMSSSATPIH